MPDWPHVALSGYGLPGLHSIFSNFTVNSVETMETVASIYYRVKGVDDRFRLVTQEVQGGGWSGIIESFARIPPCRATNNG